MTFPTGSQFCNMISKSVNFDRSCTTGWGGRIAPSKRWMSSSWSDGMGAAFGGGRGGVGNNFLMMSSNDSVSGDPTGDCSSSVTWQTARGECLSVHLPTTRNLEMTLPHATTVYYVRHRSIGSQTIQVPAECALRLSINETARTICNWISGSISTNALRASVSNSMAKIDGSSPGRRKALLTWRLYSANRTGEL